MPDNHAVEVGALRRENLELLAAHRAVVSMRRDGRAGRLVRARGGSEAHLFVLGDLAFAGRALDDAGFDAGVADAAVNLADIDRRDVVDAPLLEVGGVAEVFLVQSRRADYSHARRGGHLGHEDYVAADVHRARIDEGLEAEVADFLEALDAIFECGLALEFRRGAIELPSGPAYQQMLMHEGGAELFGTGGSSDGVDCFHRDALPHRRDCVSACRCRTRLSIFRN